MDRHHGRRDADERSPLLQAGPPSPSPPPSPSAPASAATTAPDVRVDDDIDDGATTWSELRLLASYSLPLIATYLLQYSSTVITTVVAGRLGPDDLAAVSIGATTMNVVGLGVYEGMATALDTLCAQAYGSGNKAGVGLHVQRMLLLMALATVPLGAFWAWSPHVLPLVVRQRALAARAGSFLRHSLVGLPGYGAFEALKRFTQAQGDARAAMAVLVVCAPVNALLAWLLAFPAGLGLDGAALGAALSNNLRFALLLLYIVSPAGRWSHQCWAGFSADALRGWRPMLALSAAGTAAILAEWAAFEILTFSTSYISTQHLAAQTILTTATVIAWHVPFSVSVAISTRLGHLVGAAQLPTARKAARVYAAAFAAIGALDAAVFYAFRSHITRVFSDDPLVRAVTARSFLTVAVFQVLDSVACGASGAMRGFGRQDVAAWIVLVVNYAGAVPLAIWLELGPLAWGLDGVWVGFALGQLLTVVLECAYLRWLDWEKCVESVKAREEM